MKTIERDPVVQVSEELLMHLIDHAPEWLQARVMTRNTEHGLVTVALGGVHKVETE